METKNILAVVGIVVLIVVGLVCIDKAAGSFKKFQEAQTAQLAGF